MKLLQMHTSVCSRSPRGWACPSWRECVSAPDGNIVWQFCGNALSHSTTASAAGTFSWTCGTQTCGWLALLFRQQGSRQRYSLSWKGGVIVPASEFSFFNGLFDMYFNYYFLWMTIYFSGNVMEVPSWISSAVSGVGWAWGKGCLASARLMLLSYCLVECVGRTARTTTKIYLSLYCGKMHIT